MNFGFEGFQLLEMTHGLATRRASCLGFRRFKLSVDLGQNDCLTAWLGRSSVRFVAKFLDVAELCLFLFLLIRCRSAHIVDLLLVGWTFEEHSEFPSASSWLNFERVEQTKRPLGSLYWITGLKFQDLEVCHGRLEEDFFTSGRTMQLK